MAKQIADGVWLDNNHLRKEGVFHDKGPNWCPTYTAIMSYYKVLIAGTYEGHQLVNREDISAAPVFSLSGTVQDVVFKANGPMQYIATFSNVTIVDGTMVSDREVRVNVGKTITIKVTGLELNQITDVTENTDDSYGDPNNSGSNYQLTSIRTGLDVYVNGVFVIRAENNTPTTLQVSTGDILTFGSTYNGSEGSNPSIEYHDAGTFMKTRGTLTIT